MRRPKRDTAGTSTGNTAAVDRSAAAMATEMSLVLTDAPAAAAYADSRSWSMDALMSSAADNGASEDDEEVWPSGSRRGRAPLDRTCSSASRCIDAHGRKGSIPLLWWVARDRPRERRAGSAAAARRAAADDADVFGVTTDETLDGARARLAPAPRSAAGGSSPPPPAVLSPSGSRRVRQRCKDSGRRRAVRVDGPAVTACGESNDGLSCSSSAPLSPADDPEGVPNRAPTGSGDGGRSAGTVGGDGGTTGAGMRRSASSRAPRWRVDVGRRRRTRSGDDAADAADGEGDGDSEGDGDAPGGGVVSPDETERRRDGKLSGDGSDVTGVGDGHTAAGDDGERAGPATGLTPPSPTQLRGRRCGDAPRLDAADPPSAPSARSTRHLRRRTRARSPTADGGPPAAPAPEERGVEPPPQKKPADPRLSPTPASGDGGAAGKPSPTGSGDTAGEGPSGGVNDSIRTCADGGTGRAAPPPPPPPPPPPRCHRKCRANGTDGREGKRPTAGGGVGTPAADDDDDDAAAAAAVAVVAAEAAGGATAMATGSTGRAATGRTAIGRRTPGGGG